MAEEPELLDVGVVTKPHGLRGEVVVHAFTEIAERFAAGAELSTDAGPMRILRSRQHQGSLLVVFEGVDSREAAEALRGRVLRAAPIEVDGVWFVHQLLGCRVVTTDGTELGIVSAVEANPASDLLVLEGGALIPLTFALSVSPGAEVVVELPEGLASS